MGDLGEAVGTAVEGGLIGRAVAAETDKPGRGAPALVDGHFAEAACLNCGTALVGPHCHQCGQQAHLHRTIGAFLHDLLHGALHFDGKTWRTLPKLALKPGELTRRYIDGERARFVSPMALFLFSVFLMFAVFQAIGLTTPTEVGNVGMQRAFAQAHERLLEDLTQAQARLADTPADSPDRASAQQLVVDAETAVRAIEAIPDTGLDYAPTDFNVTGIGWVDRGIVKKWQENPGLMLYKLQANSYKFSWLLIPLSVPFVWLLFLWKRGFRAYDHAIFVTYSLAFMSLLFVALSVVQAAGVSSGTVLLAASLIPPVHIYKQLRHTYALSRFSALWRLSVLAIFITVVVTLFLEILLLLGAF